MTPTPLAPTRPGLRRTCILAAMALLMGAGAQAQDPSTYLDLRAAGVLGSAKAPRAQWIEVWDAGFDVTASTSYTKGAGGANVGSAVTSGLSWIQPTGPSVAQLQAKFGQTIANETFDLVRPGTPNQAASLQLRPGALTLDTVQAFDDLVRAEQRFASMAMSYRPSAADGTLGSSIALNWNVNTNSSNITPYVHPALPLDTLPAADGNPLHQYLRFADSSTGARFAGESRVQGYENWIELSSSNWGFSAAAIGGAVAQPFSWTQTVDRSSLYTLQSLIAGRMLPRATIEFTLDTDGGPSTLMQLVLDAPFLTGFSLTGDQLTQSMVFRRATEIHWQIDPLTGDRSNQSAVTIDVALGTVSANGNPLAPMTGFGSGSLGYYSPTVQSPIPEPRKLALMLAGLGVVAWVGRRRGAAVRGPLRD